MRLSYKTPRRVEAKQTDFAPSGSSLSSSQDLLHFSDTPDREQQDPGPNLGTKDLPHTSTGILADFESDLSEDFPIRTGDTNRPVPLPR